MPIRGIGHMKLKTLEKNLAKLEREAKAWQEVNARGITGTTNHQKPKEIADYINQYKAQIAKLKAKKGGGRKTRRRRNRGTRRH
jgi:flagellar biosynthesis chaperone FliJ